jgi:hypothetical protein
MVWFCLVALNAIVFDAWQTSYYSAIEVSDNVACDVRAVVWCCSDVVVLAPNAIV